MRDVVALAEPARAEVVGIKVIAGALLALPSDVDAKPGLVIFDRCSERSRAEARASSEVVRLVMPCGGQASPRQARSCKQYSIKPRFAISTGADTYSI